MPPRRTALLALLLSACVSPPALGAVCARTSDCASPLACHFGRCRAACEATRDCLAGASCLLDSDGVGTCSLDVDLGCESGVGRACPTGLVCVADRCAQRCSATVACATGAVCAEAGGGSFFCAPSDDHDAGLADAGDAATEDASDAALEDASDAAADDASDAAADDASTTSLLEGCVLLLHMDEASWSGAASEVVDASGLGNAGTAIGGATTLDDPTRGRVGHFSAGACVRVPDAASLDASSAVTMSAWVHPIGLDGSAAFGIVSKRTDFDVDDAYDMYIWTGNRVFVDLDGANDRFSAPTTFVNTTWRQVTVTFDSARPAAERVRVLIDGELDDVRTESSATIPPLPSDLAVGCLPASGPAQSFSGDLDDVAVWTRALSDAEVAAWYAATR